MSVSKNNDYTTGNFSEYEYTLIVIDLSRQNELENPSLKQQITFMSKSENDKARMLFIIIIRNNF